MLVVPVLRSYELSPRAVDAHILLIRSCCALVNHRVVYVVRQSRLSLHLLCSRCIHIIVTVRVYTNFWLRLNFHKFYVLSFLWPVSIERHLTIESLINDLIHFLRSEESLKSYVGSAHEADPAHNFHFFGHLEIAEVRKFVSVRETPLAAVTDDRVQYSLQAQLYAGKEADWESDPCVLISLAADPSLAIPSCHTGGSFLGLR